MFTYGFWFYEELVDKVGVDGGKHRGQPFDHYMDLETPDHNIFTVKVTSYRLELFKRSPKCVSCDRVGSIWLLQAHHRREPPHLNLYHLGEPLEQWKRSTVDGLVLMTKDHIIPRSRGGPSNLTNYQTMCSICNGNKGDQMPKLSKEYDNVFDKASAGPGGNRPQSKDRSSIQGQISEDRSLDAERFACALFDPTRSV